jgi:hypothetical protein
MQAQDQRQELHGSRAHRYVYDALPSILHMLYFIVAQGYDVQ